MKDWKLGKIVVLRIVCYLNLCVGYVRKFVYYCLFGFWEILFYVCYWVVIISRCYLLVKLFLSLLWF